MVRVLLEIAIGLAWRNYVILLYLREIASDLICINSLLARLTIEHIRMLILTACTEKSVNFEGKPKVASKSSISEQT